MSLDIYRTKLLTPVDIKELNVLSLQQQQQGKSFNGKSKKHKKGTYTEDQLLNEVQSPVFYKDHKRFNQTQSMHA